MQIAVCIYGHGLNAGGMEDCFGSFAGSECLTAAAVFQLQVNPFNVMLFQHGVNGAAYLYFYGVAFNGNGRNVLFQAGVNSVALSSSMGSPQQITGTPAS